MVVRVIYASSEFIKALKILVGVIRVIGSISGLYYRKTEAINLTKGVCLATATRSIRVGMPARIDTVVTLVYALAQIALICLRRNGLYDLIFVKVGGGLRLFSLLSFIICCY